jgi:hypothetical protein
MSQVRNQQKQAAQKHICITCTPMKVEIFCFNRKLMKFENKCGKLVLTVIIIFILFVMFYSFVFQYNFVLSYCITRHCIVLSLVYNFNIFIAKYLHLVTFALHKYLYILEILGLYVLKFIIQF